MPSYQNPAGAPLVMFGGPVQYGKDEVAAACRSWGSSLWLPQGCKLDGAQLLWALAGAESSFGVNCKPRHEMAYCSGAYSKNDVVVALTSRFGHAAHASFGPWQMLLVNRGPMASPDDFDTASSCARMTVGHINTDILQRQGAKTLADIADAYNSGSCRDNNVPTQYIAIVRQFYFQPMPAPRVAPAV